MVSSLALRAVSWEASVTDAEQPLAWGQGQQARGRRAPLRPHGPALLCRRIQHLGRRHRRLQPGLHRRGRPLRAPVLPEEAGLPAEAGLHVPHLRRWGGAPVGAGPGAALAPLPSPLGWGLGLDKAGSTALLPTPL